LIALERELWACALLIEREQGDNAAVYIAERIGDLALEGVPPGLRDGKRLPRSYHCSGPASTHYRCEGAGSGWDDLAVSSGQRPRLTDKGSAVFGRNPLPLTADIARAV